MHMKYVSKGYISESIDDVDSLDHFLNQLQTKDNSETIDIFFSH